MRTFVVGAGLPHTASYPLTRHLFDAIEQRVSTWANSNGISWMKDWKEFVDWLRNRRPNFLVAQAGREADLEYILTVMDLYVALGDQLENRAIANQLSQVFEGRQSRGSDTTQRLYVKRRKMLEEVRKHRRLLSLALAKFFEERHYQDSRNDTERLESVRVFCEKVVKPRDIIVTFNYDATIERCLLQLGHWHPRDGYGFPRELVGSGNSPAARSAPSQIKVLKLHGSVGWLSRDGKAAALDSTFLRYLGLNLQDKESPPGRERFPLIEPSFIKKLGNEPLMKIWQWASEALDQGRKIYILGYSLRPADSAVQTFLLASCRGKARRGRVVVIDNSEEVLERYGSLLPGCKRVRSDLELWVNDRRNQR